MGADPSAVVDPTNFKVRGLEGLPSRSAMSLGFPPINVHPKRSTKDFISSELRTTLDSFFKASMIGAVGPAEAAMPDYDMRLRSGYPNSDAHGTSAVQHRLDASGARTVVS